MSVAFKWLLLLLLWRRKLFVISTLHVVRMCSLNVYFFWPRVVFEHQYGCYWMLEMAENWIKKRIVENENVFQWEFWCVSVVGRRIFQWWLRCFYSAARRISSLLLFICYISVDLMSTSKIPILWVENHPKKRRRNTYLVNSHLCSYAVQ